MMTWKIVVLAKASILYIYIYIDNIIAMSCILYMLVRIMFYINNS